MKAKSILGLAVVGAIGYYLYKMYKKNKDAKSMTPMKVVEKLTAEVKNNYTNAFLKQYDIIVPPKQASKAVEDAGFRLQEDRIIIENSRMAAKKPVYL
jgi:hypothetical protein